MLAPLTVLTLRPVDLRGLPLGARDGFVLAQIDGRVTLAEVAEITGLTVAETITVAERLVTLGAVASSLSTSGRHSRVGSVPEERFDAIPGEARRGRPPVSSGAGARVARTAPPARGARELAPSAPPRRGSRKSLRMARVSGGPQPTPRASDASRASEASRALAEEAAAAIAELARAVPSPPVSSPAPAAATPSASSRPASTTSASAPPASTPSAAPASAPPVSAPPVSAPPASASPVSAPPASASPVSALPASAPPASAPPESDLRRLREGVANVNAARNHERAEMLVAAGEESVRKGDLSTAANQLRLALQHREDAALRIRLEEIEALAKGARLERALSRARAAEKDLRWAEAAALFAQALEIRPDAAVAERAAHTLHASGGDLEQALVFAATAVKMRGGNGDYRATLAELLLAAGQHASAAEEAAAALAISPGHPRAQAVATRAAKKSRATS